MMLTNLATQLLGAAARLDAIDPDAEPTPDDGFAAAMSAFDDVLEAIEKALGRGPGVYICADGSVKIAAA